MIGRQFQMREEAKSTEKAFAAAWTLTPSESILRFELAGLYGNVGEWPKALDNYRAALLIDPENNPEVGNADVLLSEHFAKEVRAAFWREIAERHPVSLHPWLRLGIALEGTGETAAAAAAYVKAYENHPEDAEASIRSVASHADTLTPKALEEMLYKALEKDPGLTALAVSCIDKVAQEWMRLERIEEAVAAYDLAARFDPENGWVRLRQAEVAAAAGNTEEARNGFEALLTGPHGREAANGLNLLLHKTGESGIGYWQDLDRRIPGNEHVQSFLEQTGRTEALILFESGDYPAAITVLEAACPDPCLDPNQAVLLLTAKLLNTGDEDLRPLVEAVQGGIFEPGFRLVVRRRGTSYGDWFDRSGTDRSRVATRIAAEDEAGWLQARQGPAKPVRILIGVERLP